MKKSYILTFTITLLVVFSVSVIVLMLMLPQQTTESQENVATYEEVQKSKYTYESTKDVPQDPLNKQYAVTGDQMNQFKAKSQYKVGNSDPFTSQSTTDNTSGSTTGGTSGSTPVTNQQANNNTTNSNGGVANPPATTK